MTRTLSVGGTHADTNKELYVNGDIEATATLEVGGTTTLTGKATLVDDIEMTKQSAALTHAGASGGTSGLTIESTHGFVDVESVRFTGRKLVSMVTSTSSRCPARTSRSTETSAPPVISRWVVTRR